MTRLQTTLQRIASLGVAGIGAYMALSFAWLTPPVLSGIAFILIALALWIPVCPILSRHSAPIEPDRT